MQIALAEKQDQIENLPYFRIPSATEPGKFINVREDAFDQLPQDIWWKVMNYIAQFQTDPVYLNECTCEDEAGEYNPGLDGLGFLCIGKKAAKRCHERKMARIEGRTSVRQTRAEGTAYAKGTRAEGRKIFQTGRAQGVATGVYDPQGWVEPVAGAVGNVANAAIAAFGGGGMPGGIPGMPGAGSGRGGGVMPPPDQEEEKSFIEKNWPYLLGGGVLLAGGIYFATNK